MIELTVFSYDLTQDSHKINIVASRISYVIEEDGGSTRIWLENGVDVWVKESMQEVRDRWFSATSRK